MFALGSAGLRICDSLMDADMRREADTWEGGAQRPELRASKENLVPNFRKGPTNAAKGKRAKPRRTQRPPANEERESAAARTAEEVIVQPVADLAPRLVDERSTEAAVVANLKRQADEESSSPPLPVTAQRHQRFLENARKTLDRKGSVLSAEGLTSVDGACMLISTLDVNSGD